eukprot:Skav236265  [mRNA]  locus=scaffold829:674872:678056:- [translate_table: standard]
MALLVLDTDGGRLAVKYNSACNDVVVAAVAAGSENELVVLELAQCMFNSLSSACQSQSFLSAGLTKQLVLDNLSDVLFILDEVTDNGVIMETDDEKISARIKMIDETEGISRLTFGSAHSARDLVEQKETQSRFEYVHKHTYATGDPKAAAYFVAEYFGGWCNHEPGHGKQHTHCNGTDFEQPITWNAYFPASLQQPLGFSIHFVKNPHKLPAQAPMNETELGLLVEKWRGNLSQTGRFDQFMDNHLGLVFNTLDPLVEKWQRDGVPFICRSWCCGPGMEQWPDRCPFGHSSDTDFCEQGCYVEVPHGIILEALCGLENYKASRKCLTKVPPHQLKSFDLCSDN